ncbi:hypothetical protein CV014_06165 [Nostoc sp. CMAA1605]|nr:hypothetical protein [Nostoc sp. CMAA1605]
MLCFSLFAAYTERVFLQTTRLFKQPLRCSPAWSMGNIVLPYPMHLGQEVIEDHLCVLGA